jgi:hypothetical protein
MVTELSIAKGFLAFSHPTLIVPCLIIGFLLEKNGLIKNSHQSSTIWQHACLLILFTMIFNTLLKSLFLVPLNPAIGKEGFAFPSGHMQVSVAFYGWVFWAYANRSVRGLILLILTGVGWGLMQQGYHTLEDVVAAAVVGIITIYGFAKITHLSFIQNNPAHLGLCLIPVAGLMMGVIHYRIGIPPHIIVTFMGLVGIVMGCFLKERLFAK